MRAYERLEITKIQVEASESAKAKPNPTEIKPNPTEIKPNQIKSNQNPSKLKPEAKSSQIQAQAKPNQTKSSPKPATQASQAKPGASQAPSQPRRHALCGASPVAAPVAPHIGRPCRGPHKGKRKCHKTMNSVKNHRKFLGTRKFTSHQSGIQATSCRASASGSLGESVGKVLGSPRK